jgi:PIN domain nuclease of toxin-antitoxin system
MGRVGLVKLLLDIHFWLWALLDPDRLSPAVREALAAADNELWLSPISVWEAHLLAERGRVRVATAQVLGLTLVTADARLTASTEYAVMANG